MENVRNSTQKIDEALELLNEAAREKKEELRSILSEKYSHIKEALTEVALGNQEVLDQVKRLAGERLGEKLEEGQERLVEAAQDVDREVRRNPWPYVGGAALGALLLGFILGTSKK